MKTTDWDSAINRINLLLDENESLKADLEQALSLLARTQWHDVGDTRGELFVCLECQGMKPRGHHPGCTWANLLARYGREVKYSD